MNVIMNIISIKGYKSIKDFRLMPLNILIGANGSGKSNFIEHFVFLKEIISRRMQFYVNKKGGADMHLYLGPKETEQIKSIFQIGDYHYKLILESTVDNRFVISQELLEYQNQEAESRSGHDESVLESNSNELLQGLHPDALNVLAGLFKQASHHTQILIATQSATLLNNFYAKNIIFFSVIIVQKLMDDNFRAGYFSYTLSARTFLKGMHH